MISFDPSRVMAESAHPAYDKGCHYFGIKLRRAKVGKDYRADVASIRRLVNANTVMASRLCANCLYRGLQKVGWYKMSY